MSRTTISRIALLILAPLIAQAGWTQAIPGAGYALRTIDGDNDIGAHMALTTRGGGTTAFFYFADQGQLVAANCFDATCTNAYAISNPAFDRGQYVSAATRTALNNRPIAAYYDATNGDLMAVDCLSIECSFSIERTLESLGNVGQDTAIVVDPGTGLSLIAYYDVDNADLRLYRCATAVCDSGNSVLVNGTNDRGHNVSMVFAGSTLWMAYEDRSSGELILARSTSPFNTFAILSQAVGVEPSLTANSAGFLDMVWRDTTSNTLQQLQCLNSNCTSANQTTVAGAGRGFRPSSTRLPNGNLLVSHFEPSTQSIRGTLCNDLSCSSPQSLVFDSGPAISGKSVMRTTNAGQPLVFFHDTVRADARATQCTTAACDTFIQRVAFNGFPVSGARLALRPDGRPLIAYIRQRQPWLAQCSDRLCSAISRTLVPGFNSETRPALAVRADNHPIVYYASLGGSELYDCDDIACSSGNPRMVSGSGNATSSYIEMALRTDGRPVLLYASTSANDVFVFDCADLDCSNGTQRLLVDEPTGNGTSVSNFAIVIGSGDRPIVMYSLISNSGSQQRYVRCNDSNCIAATAINVGANANFFATPLALRSDGRVAFIEWSTSNLAICDNIDCSGVARFPIATGGIVRSLVMQSGDRPTWESASIGFGAITSCDDSLCSAQQQRVALTDANAQSSYLGSLAVDAAGVAFAAFEEQSLGDIILAIPLPDAVFSSGFE